MEKEDRDNLPIQTFRESDRKIKILKEVLDLNKSEAIREAINHRISCPLHNIEHIDYSEYATISEIVFQTGKDFSTVYRWSEAEEVEIKNEDRKSRLIHVESLEKFLGYTLGTIQANQVSSDETMDTFEVMEYLNVRQRKVHYFRERGHLTPIKKDERPLRFLKTQVEDLKLFLSKPKVEKIEKLDETE